MSILFEVCKWIVIVLAIYTTPLMIWMIITAIAGLFPAKELKQTEKKQHRFAVIICARNEQNVIVQLIDSLQKQDYDKSLYHCFVVADNCTDDTAKVSKDSGATVFERFNIQKKGKGFALQWGIAKLLKEYKNEFDAICVFDADNLAAPDFLTEMNKALCSDAHVALGYRDSKNIHDSWISETYSLYWLMLMRFYHTPRHKMGLSSMVGGTGFAFKISALGKDGWCTHSLTEDVEFSIQQICAGHHIIPARKAVFFDEQPVSLKVSIRQRMRWMIGGIQCIPLYLKTILHEVFSGKPKALDLAWYILFIPAAGLTIIMNIAAAVCTLLNPQWQPYAIPIMLGLAALSWIFTTIVALLTLVLEHKKVKPMIRAVLLYPIFMFSMMCIALAALVHPKTEWVPIEHKSKNTIEDMNT
ncbi:MAG: glycosyltransferase family 2 protein [Christensenellaceae bacterium]